MAKKKKSKKRIQKKRQEKALKRRAQKKLYKKKTPKRTPGMPGTGMALPPGVAPQQAQQLMEFLQPLIPLLEDLSPAQSQQVLILFKNIFLAFSERNLDRRNEQLARIQPLYEQLPESRPPFDTMMEILLKRHIYLFPELHSEEERSFYTPAELEFAMSVQALQTLPSTREEQEEVEEVALSLEDLARPNLDAIRVKGIILTDEQTRYLPNLFEEIQREYDQIDFLDEENPVLRRVMEFQEKLLQGFERALGTVKMLSPVARRLHTQNVRPLPEPFLREYHSASLFSMTEEHLEEYVLSYYPNKAEAPPEARRLLIHSLDAFIDFLEIMRFLKSGTSFRQVLREVEEEYYEMLEEEEESFSEEEEDAEE